MCTEAQSNYCTIHDKEVPWKTKSQLNDIIHSKSKLIVADKLTSTIVIRFEVVRNSCGLLFIIIIIIIIITNQQFHDNNIGMNNYYYFLEKYTIFSKGLFSVKVAQL